MMRILKILFTFFLAFVSILNASPDKKERNKKVVLAFENECWHQKDTAAVYKLVNEGYIQHNPFAGDGPESIIQMFGYVSPKIKTIRSIAEGDLVLQHNISSGWGDTLTYVSFDVFRVKDNQIVEHWDVMQPNANETVSGRTMTDGEAKIIDLDKTAANKKLVQGFVDECIYGNHWENIEQYISKDKYFQHNPHVGDGISGLNDALKNMMDHGMTMKYEKTYRIIAEGNFVFVHSKGEFGGKKVAFADLMRVENGKIVEHWDCIQEIPAQTKSGHDMFEQISN